MLCEVCVKCEGPCADRADRVRSAHRVRNTVVEWSPSSGAFCQTFASNTQPSGDQPFAGLAPLLRYGAFLGRYWRSFRTGAKHA